MISLSVILSRSEEIEQIEFEQLHSTLEVFQDFSTQCVVSIRIGNHIHRINVTNSTIYYTVDQ